MARLRVNLHAGEFEVEGPEAFVERYAARIEKLLQHLAPQAPAASAGALEPVPVLAELDATASFGAWSQRLPRAATDVDRMLLAGWYLQHHAVERWFTTSDANRLLIEHGFKLGNASQSVKQNLMAKRAFLVQRGRYRVAQSGIDHLQHLTGAAIGDG